MKDSKFMLNNKTLLEVSNVSKDFQRINGSKNDLFRAVDRVSFSVQKGEILGILGESGCGKTTLARMITGLTAVTEGSIYYDACEIQLLGRKEFRPYRKRIQMVFQNPFASLDPGKKVENLLLEPMEIWGIGKNRKERLERVEQICCECGINDRAVLQKKPAEFSGGQLQRLSIARALLVEPEFLIADEIVSALDVPIQNQILELLLTLRKKKKLTVLMITHDLAAMSLVSDRVLVMRHGQIVQSGTIGEIIRSKNDYMSELRDAAYVF